MCWVMVRRFYGGLRWLVPLLMAMLATGLAVAAANAPAIFWDDWNGTPPVTISESDLHAVEQPDLAVEEAGDGVVVVWRDEVSGTGAVDIFARRSDDRGLTWSAPQVVSNSLRDSAVPAVAMAGDRAFVAWIEQENNQAVAVYEREVVTGTAHRIPITASGAYTSLGNLMPALAATDDGVLHLVVNVKPGSSQTDLHYATRTLTATVWPTTSILYKYDPTFGLGAWDPSLSVDPDGQRLHLVWVEQGMLIGDYGKEGIGYRRMAADGTWGAVTHIEVMTPTVLNWVNPDVAADSAGNVYVVWGEEFGGNATPLNYHYVRFARYDVGAGDWLTSTLIYASPLQVTDQEPKVLYPSLALREMGGSVELCVSWHGFAVGAVPPAEEILISCSSDKGDTWTLPVSVSRSPGDPLGTDLPISIKPSMAYDQQGRLHIAWRENVSGTLAGSLRFDIRYAYSNDKVYLPLVVRNY